MFCDLHLKMITFVGYKISFIFYGCYFLRASIAVRHFGKIQQCCFKVGGFVFFRVVLKKVLNSNCAPYILYQA